MGPSISSPHLLALANFWMLASILSGSFYYFHNQPWIDVAVIFFAVIYFIFPGWLTLLFNVAFQASVAMFFYPYIENSWNIRIIVYLVVMANLAGLVIRRLTADTLLSGAQLTTSIKQRIDDYLPALRLATVVFYIVCGIHKLNTGFLAAESSCVNDLFMSVINQFRLSEYFKPAHWLVFGGIAFTLVIELVAPLLLLTNRFRNLALSGFFFFHIYLSFHYPMFSVTMMGLLFLFLPSATVDSINRAVGSFIGCAPLRRLSALFPLLAAAVVHHFSVRPLYAQADDPQNILPGALFMFILICYSLVFIWTRKGSFKMGLTPASNEYFGLAKLNAGGLAIILLIIFNGLSPYLGLKTFSTFAMFSNLRTEGFSNHLFIPHAWQMTGRANDLYEIVETNIPSMRQFADGSRYVVGDQIRLGLKSYRGDWREATLWARRLNGSRDNLVSIDHFRSKPPSLLERKFFAFKPVWLDGRCSW